MNGPAYDYSEQDILQDVKALHSQYTEGKDKRYENGKRVILEFPFNGFLRRCECAVLGKTVQGRYQISEPSIPNVEEICRNTDSITATLIEGGAVMRFSATLEFRFFANACQWFIRT